MAMLEKTQIAFHPLADVLPLIEGTEFDQLVASVKVNGLRDPIIIFEGKILDGRNRYRACLKAGVEPHTENFSGGDPVLFVIDRNLHRRHLTTGQKAMAAEQFATLLNGQTWTKLARSQERARTRDEVAKLAGVGITAITDAKIIKRNGTAEEVAAVAKGKRNIRTVAKEIRARRSDKKPPANRKGGIRQKTKVAIFQRALSLLCNSCDHIEEMDMPILTDDQRKIAERQLLDAERALRNFRGRVREETSNARKV